MFPLRCGWYLLLAYSGAIFVSEDASWASFAVFSTDLESCVEVSSKAPTSCPCYLLISGRYRGGFFVTAVSLHDPSREKVNRENPQIFPIYKSQIIFPLQRRRPPPVAETGRSCWDSGQQDASAAQGTMRMLGAATRKTRRAFKSSYTAPKIVALYGARGALPVKMRLGPRHRLEEVPSLSSFHCPAGRETVQAVSVGL